MKITWLLNRDHMRPCCFWQVIGAECRSHLGDARGRPDGAADRHRESPRKPAPVYVFYLFEICYVYSSIITRLLLLYFAVRLTMHRTLYYSRTRDKVVVEQVVNE